MRTLCVAVFSLLALLSTVPALAADKAIEIINEYSGSGKESITLVNLDVIELPVDNRHEKTIRLERGQHLTLNLPNDRKFMIEAKCREFLREPHIAQYQLAAFSRPEKLLITSNCRLAAR